LGTANGQLLLSEVSFDRSTGKYSADLRVKNVGSSVLSRNLAVLLSELPAGVTVANASGIHAAGSAYLNFAPVIQSGGLGSGAISGAIRVEINDPNLQVFSFKPVVLQGAAEPIPDLTALRNLTVKVGEKLDFALDPNLAFSIAATGNLPTGSITGDSHLIFRPAPTQVGTYDFTLIARNGAVETRQAITLTVVPDPVTTTRVTGVIADTNQAGIAGVLVEFAGQQATTDGAGKFELVVPAGAAGDTLKVYGQRIQGGGVTYPFIAEKLPLLLGHDVYQGVNNDIDRPIYLPTIDVSTGTTIIPYVQTIATNPNLVGAQVTVDANSLYDKNGNAFEGVLSITEVPPSLTPAALPANMHPDLVVTIQPGDMVFNTPAQLVLPNRVGYKPGVLMDLWSINPNTGDFEIVGKGQVSSDGSVIETIQGGIRNSSWHFFVTPPNVNLFIEENHQKNTSCSFTQSFKSEVSPLTGVVSDDRELVTYTSQGIDRGVRLHYDSMRANPNQIFRINGYVDSTLLNTDLLTVKITISGNGIEQTISGLNSSQPPGLKGGERIWTVANRDVNTGIHADLNYLGSGVYDSQLEVGMQGFRATLGTGTVGSTRIYADKVIVVNDSDSVFGGGWNVAGLQKLVFNQDQSVLLINGDGSQLLFESLVGNVYKPLTGDFSKLEKLGDGTFRRVTKDGSQYQFNTKGLMVAVVDKVGNITRHVYNQAGNIQQIIDPVGLITTFTYTNKRVTSISDPAGRTTILSYDPHGNLISISDPDGSQNSYGYNEKHLLSSSIDKIGQVRTGTYDEFGRAKTATREDGSTIQITPVEVQGLLNSQQSTNLANIPVVDSTPFRALSSYTDGNGYVSKTVLNQYGKVISQADNAGAFISNTYNSNGLIDSRSNGNKETTNYQYDERGNVTSTQIDYSSNELLVGDTINPFKSLRVLEKTNTLDSIYITASGDVNNDGFADIISANSYRISVSYGNRLGTFFREYQIPTASYSNFDQNNGLVISELIEQLEVKDINDDGFADLIVSFLALNGAETSDPNAVNAILVFINKGSGQLQDRQFENAQILRLPTLMESNTPRGFTIGDFNNDNKLDILAIEPFYGSLNNSDKLVLFAGDGNGAFTASTVIIPELSNAIRPSYGIYNLDVDGDGQKELVLNSVENLMVFKFESDTATWTSIASYTSNYYESRRHIEVGDLNGDGLGDLVTYGDRQVQIFLGQANGGFSSQTMIFDDAFLILGSYEVDMVKIADINNDGKADVAVSGRTVDPDVSWRRKLISKVYDIDNGNQLQLLMTTAAISRPTILINGRFSEEEYKFAGLLDVNKDGDLDFVLLESDFDRNSGDKTAIIDNQSVIRQITTLTEQYTYDPVFNQLTSITDELGRKTLYTLDSNNGNVLRTTRVVGQLDTNSNENDDVITTYTYTPTGQIDIVTDALSHITDYDYDGRGNLVKVTTAKGTLDQAIEQYEYDLAGNRTAMIDANGHRTVYVYNSTNMLLQSIDPLGGTTTYNYDRMGHQTSMTDALGRVTRMTYDSRGRLASTIDANGKISTNAYDNNGNLLSVIDPLNRTTRYRYDTRNRLMGVIDANGGSTPVQYDLNNNVIGVTDTLGRSTQRFYDSRDRLTREVDALGNETKYRYNAVGEMIAMTDALGRTTTYQYDELGRRVAEVDALGHISRTEYNKLGDVVAIVDANGNRTEVKYDALNRRIEVKDAQGGLTKTIYDKVGNTIAVADALNRTTSFNYDALDRLITTTDPLGHSATNAFDAVGNLLSVTDTLGRTTTYTYDNLNRQVSMTDALGQTNSVTYDAVGNRVKATDALGRVTSFTYDVLGRMTALIDALGHVQATSYDSEGNVLSVADALGNTTGYAYDALNRRVKITDAQGGIATSSYDAVGNLLLVKDALNRTTTFAYDSLDRRNSVVDALGNATTSSFDATGNLLSVTDALGRTTAYTYDSLNRQVSATDALGQTKLVTYDALGNRIKVADELGRETSFTYDLLDRMTALTDALGHVWVTSYDSESNVLSVTDALGNTTRYVYDALNRQVKVTDAQGGITTSSYDAVGNLLSVKDALNHTTTFVYDDLNRRNSVVDALGNATTSSFDAIGDLLSVTDALGRTTTFAYDSLKRRISTTDVLGQTQSAVYDAVNNLLSVTNELGQVTSFIYDALDRRTGVTDALGHAQTTVYDAISNVRSTTDSIGNTTSFDYDALNRQVKVTDAKGGITGTNYNAVGNVAKITDSVGNSTTYTYDAIDRLITDTNQLGFSRSYVYDAVGNRVTMVDRNNRKTTYAYDSLNRQTSENWIGAGGVSLRAIGYTYDAVGNMLTVTDPDAKYTYGYDALNRISSVDNAGTTGVPTVAFNYLYDTVGRLVTVGDRLNNANAGQTDYAFDQLNRVTRITQSGVGVQSKRVDMNYNKVNQMTGLRRFNDLGGANLVAESSYVYDQSQRLTQLAHKKGVNNLASYDYTYDSANKLTKIVSSIDGTVDYTYDATNQLTGADHSSQADEAYQYDANGNRMNAGYQTGINNQLLADGQFTYEYDHEGNRTKRTETATNKVTEYVWDYHNRLTGVVLKDAAGVVLKNIEYTYDVNNQRIGKKIDGVVTERYVLDRNQIALVFDGQGVQKSRYLYGTQVDQVLAEESGTQVRWFLADHQGTVKDVIDNAGIAIDHITYDSFGRIVSQTNPIELRFAYTGREWDGETGQYYYRARYYDPADGRFISEDPIGFRGNDLNLSRYVGNSPTIFTDSSGYAVDVLDKPPTAPVVAPSAAGLTMPSWLLPGVGLGAVLGGILILSDQKPANAPMRPDWKPQEPPQPQNPDTPTNKSTEAYGPRQNLSPEESQRLLEKYDAQDRKVRGRATRDRQKKADWLRRNGYRVPDNSVLDNMEISEQTEQNSSGSRGNFHGPLYFPPARTTAPEPKPDYKKAPNPNKCDLEDEKKRCPNPLPVFIETQAYPEHYALVSTAIRYFGKPTILTRGEGVDKYNRRYGGKNMHRIWGSADFYGTMSTMVRRPFGTTSGRGGLSLAQWDEYPYASTVEGANSVFASVDKTGNESAGRALKTFYSIANYGRPLPFGCQFRVQI
jgi:RHS repeat-associated protein